MSSWNPFKGRGGAGANNNAPPPPQNNNNDLDDNEDFDADEDDDMSSSKKRNMFDGNFDPRALERGAEALKAIDSSKNSRAALMLAREQERTKQQEARVRAEQNRAAAAQMEGDNIKRRGDEDRKTQQARGEEARETARERAQIEQQLTQKKLQEQQALNEQWLKEQQAQFLKQQQMQEETNRRIEEERRQTMAQQAKLDRETARVRALAESDGKIKQERENHDLQMEMAKLQATEHRETRLDVLNATFSHLSNFSAAARETLTDPEKMPVVVGGLTAAALGIYSSKQATKVAAKFVASRIGKPSLVRETSRKNWLKPFSAIKQSIPAFNKQSNVLDNLVLHPELESKLGWVTTAAVNTRKHNAPFRHVLAYGPPGTGKTMYAKKLAMDSGLDFAVMTGGDFAQLGSSAVTELHKVFDWAERSDKGTVIFVDEADAFLRKGRGGDAMSEEMRNTLSAFLYRTGTETNRFMVMLATNMPETLDEAVLDRLDDKIEFPNPGQDERARMLKENFHRYILEPREGDKDPIKVLGFDDEEANDKLFKGWAEETEGLSGRGLVKLVIAMQAAVFGGVAQELSPPLATAVLKATMKDKKF